MKWFEFPAAYFLICFGEKYASLPPALLQVKLWFLQTTSGIGILAGKLKNGRKSIISNTAKTQVVKYSKTTVPVDHVVAQLVKMMIILTMHWQLREKNVIVTLKFLQRLTG